MTITLRPPVVVRPKRIPSRSDLFSATTSAVTAGVTIYCTLNWWHYRKIRKEIEKRLDDNIKEKNRGK